MVVFMQHPEGIALLVNDWHHPFSPAALLVIHSCEILFSRGWFWWWSLSWSSKALLELACLVCKIQFRTGTELAGRWPLHGQLPTQQFPLEPFFIREDHFTMLFVYFDRVFWPIDFTARVEHLVSRLDDTMLLMGQRQRRSRKGIVQCSTLKLIYGKRIT